MQEQSKRKALGRGLEELFNIEDVSYSNLEEKIMEGTKPDEVKELKVEEIRTNPYQPRKIFDEEKLKELAQSISLYGVIQPIIVKKSIKGYEIIAGERRYRASVMAGKTTIPAIIRDFSDEEMMEIAILENLQRENLNVLEEAMAYDSLMRRLNLTQEEVAKRVNKSRSHITNILGILTLPEDVKKQIAENKITMGHARVLSKLDDTEKIKYLAKKVADESLSVRELESMTSGDETPRRHKVVKQKSLIYQDLEKELSLYLGTKVKLNNKKLVISFVNDKDLNRILETINYNNK
mgnify:FL=1